MKIVIAPDSFKGSLSAQAAAQAIHHGMAPILPGKYILLPIADGGEGTMDVMLQARPSQRIQAQVHDPLGNSIQAEYGLLDQGKTAVIEMAQASGLQYVGSGEPFSASSYGTGELIKAALNQGVSKIIVALGGSGTNDGGAGILQALGLHLLDQNGHDIPQGNAALANLTQITGQIDERINKVKIIVASDVTNPLLGQNGASYIFGPQKGAKPADLPILEQNLHNFAKAAADYLKNDYSTQPGTGAAGGCGFALLAFLGAEMKAGAEVVLDTINFATAIASADFLIVGEGATDNQTKFGKAPYAAAKLAKKLNPKITVIAISGKLGQVDQLYDYLDACFAAEQGPSSLTEAISHAASNLSLTSANLARLIKKLN